MCIEEGEEKKEDMEVDKNGWVSCYQIEKVAYTMLRHLEFFCRQLEASKDSSSGESCLNMRCRNTRQLCVGKQEEARLEEKEVAYEESSINWHL